METMYSILMISGLIISCWLLARMIDVEGFVDTILVVYLSSSALIILWGYVLSALDLLGNPNGWLIAEIASLAMLLIIFRVQQKRQGVTRRRKGLDDYIKRMQIIYKDNNTSPVFVKYLMGIMLFTVFAVGVINLFILLTIPPHDWDSMTYHLPRMAHYLQQNNLDFFDANYWAQVVHPKNSTLIYIFTYLASGGNEKLLQLPQFLSYWVLAAGVLGIARNIGFNEVKSLFASLISLMTVGAITLSTTAQNDLLIAGYVSACVYFLLRYKDNISFKYPVLTVTGFALALGTKATMLVAIPSCFLMMVFASMDGKRILPKRILYIIFFMIFAGSLFVLPSGYVDNFRIFNNPFGNEDVSNTHTFKDISTGQVIKGGMYNALRLGFDNLSLVGLPPSEPLRQMQFAIRIIPQKMLDAMGIDLEDRIATGFSWFSYDASPPQVFWGIFGFMLIWPAVIFFLVQPKEGHNYFYLSLSAMIFWFVLAFSGPYDAVKGRYFLYCLPFAAPLTGIFLKKRSAILNIYLSVVIIAGCVSAISASLIKLTPFASTYPGLLRKNSILGMNRIEQLTFNYQKYTKQLILFNDMIPDNARVAVFLYPNFFEYPLYGDFLTREILPINSFHNGILDVPADAEYLLYVRGYPCRFESDIDLGQGMYLRKLNSDNRKCDS